MKLKEMNSEITETGIIFGDADAGETMRDMNKVVGDAFAEKYPSATVTSFEIWWTENGYKFEIEAKE